MGNVLQGYQLQAESHKHSVKPIKLIRFVRHNDLTCPVAWLEKYLQLWVSDVGPLFVSQLACRGWGSALKEACAFVGIDPAG